MSKISKSFLVCFSLVAGAGSALAQGGIDASAMSNSVGSSMSMDGMRASVKLSDAKPANPFSQVASSLNAAPAGTGVDIPVVQAKIGGGGPSLALPANPLGGASGSASGNMANALQGPASSNPAGDMTSSVVLGAATPDFSNAIGDQVRSNAKLGQ
mgnify:CR=1 FL=1